MDGLVYLFPGQGAQKVGMGRDLCAQSPAAQAVFAEADQALGLSLSQICFEGPAEILTDTINAQPAILATSLAWYEMARTAGAPSPRWVAGHSLGHFSALVAAGALSLSDGVRLVRERGRATKQAGQERKGSMAAVLKLDALKLQTICEEVSRQTGQYVGIANDNAPDQIVISGDASAVEQASQLAVQAGAKRVIPLAVSGAFHTPLMAGAVSSLERATAAVNIRPPQIEVISNVTAQPLGTPDEIRADIVRQLTSPVRWVSVVETILRGGGKVFVEMGPGSVLTGLVKRIAPAVEAWSLDEANGLERLLALRSSIG